MLKEGLAAAGEKGRFVHSLSTKGQKENSDVDHVKKVLPLHDRPQAIHRQ
jgi:hypothetical protein